VIRAILHYLGRELVDELWWQWRKTLPMRRWIVRHTGRALRRWAGRVNEACQQVRKWQATREVADDEQRDVWP